MKLDLKVHNIISVIVLQALLYFLVQPLYVFTNEVTVLSGQPPVISRHFEIIDEDTVYTFTPNSFDTAYSDPENDLLYSIFITQLPVLGELLHNGVTAPLNQEILIADLPNLEYIPELDGHNSNWIDADNSAFLYQASDGTNLSTHANPFNPSYFRFEIQQIDDAPVGVTDYESVSIAAPPFIMDVLDNDYDVDYYS